MKQRLKTSCFMAFILVCSQIMGATSHSSSNGAAKFTVTRSATMTTENDSLQRMAMEHRHLNDLDDDVFFGRPSSAPTMQSSQQPSIRITGSPTNLPSLHPKAPPSDVPSMSPFRSHSPSVDSRITIHLTTSPTSPGSNGAICTVTDGTFGINSPKSLSIPYKYQMDYNPVASSKTDILVKKLDQAVVQRIVKSTVLFQGECQRRILETAIVDGNDNVVPDEVVGITSSPGGTVVQASYCGENCIIVEARLKLYLADEDERRRLSNDEREEVIGDIVTSSIQSGMQNGDLLLLASDPNILGLKFLSLDTMDLATEQEGQQEGENIAGTTKANGSVSVTASVAIASMTVTVALILIMKYRKEKDEEVCEEEVLVDDEEEDDDRYEGTLNVSELDDSNIVFLSTQTQHVLTPIREHEDDMPYDENYNENEFDVFNDHRLMDDGSISMSLDNTRNCCNSMETFTAIDLDKDVDFISGSGRNRNGNASNVGNTVIV